MIGWILIGFLSWIVYKFIVIPYKIRFHYAKFDKVQILPGFMPFFNNLGWLQKHCIEPVTGFHKGLLDYQNSLDESKSGFLMQIPYPRLVIHDPLLLEKL